MPKIGAQALFQFLLSFFLSAALAVAVLPQAAAMGGAGDPSGSGVSQGGEGEFPPHAQNRDPALVVISHHLAALAHHAAPAHLSLCSGSQRPLQQTPCCFFRLVLPLVFFSVCYISYILRHCI